MAQQMVDEAGNIWEVDAGGNPVRFVGNANQSAQPNYDMNSGIVIKQGDPNKAVGARLDIEGKSIDNRTDAATLPYAGPTAAASLREKEASAALAEKKLADAMNGKVELTPEMRKHAVDAMNDAQAMRRVVADLRARNASGPGSTHGLMGLSDYFPTEANRGFDEASQRARGYVKRSLGFTGGEGNTVAESSALYEPYLPSAWDRDANITSKIDALEQLANDAEAKAHGILGTQPEQPQTPTFGQPNNPLGGVRANGVHRLADTTQSQLVGQSEGGWFADPSLADVGPTVKRMLQNNRSAAEINAYIDGRYQASGAVKMNAEQRAQIAGLVAARRRNPTIPAGQLATDWGNFGMVQRNANPNGPTLGEQFAKSPAGAFSISAGNAASAGLLDEMAGVVGGEGAQQRMQAVKDQSRAENWKSALAGDIAGGTLAMVGLNRAIGAAGQGGAKLAQWGGGIAPDIAYGAAYGAGESNDNRAMGAVTGGASAAAGNIVGRGVTGMFGRGIRGVSDPAVRYLNDRNIPLTVGQILGNRGIAGRTFSKMESVPVLGDVFNSRRMDGIKAFNRAAHEDALKPIGATIEGEAGQEAIDQAQQAVSAAYGDALNGVRMTVDLPYKQDLGQILAEADKMPSNLSEQFKSTLKTRVAPMFNRAPDGSVGIDGRGFQAAAKGMKADAGALLRRSEPMADLFKDGTVAVENALNDMAERQFPGTVPALHAANNAHRNVSILEDASLAARNSQAGSGIFTPAQLDTAMKSNTRRFGGKKAAARGDMPFNQLQQYGQEVLPSTVPNSGTADRGLAAYALPTVLGGSAAGLETFTDAPPQATVPLALLAALSTKRGSGAAQRLMVNRPDAMRKAGEALYGRRRLGGMFGAGFSAPLAISFGIGSE